MRRNVTLVRPIEPYLRNVFFLGDSTLNSVQHKRVKKSELTYDEGHRLVCYEVRNGIVWAVIKRTPEEEERKKRELKTIYPNTRF